MEETVARSQLSIFANKTEGSIRKVLNRWLNFPFGFEGIVDGLLDVAGKIWVLLGGVGEEVEDAVPFGKFLRVRVTPDF